MGRARVKPRGRPQGLCGAVKELRTKVATLERKLRRYRGETLETDAIGFRVRQGDDDDAAEIPEEF